MTVTSGSVQIISFHKNLNREEFDCGVQALNDYLSKQANQDQSRNVCRVYVLISEKNPNKIIGYYSLNVGSIALLSFPESLRKKLPKYPIPVAWIGRLAIDKAYQRKDWGETLLMHALQKIAQVSQDVGIFAVILDAKDGEAKVFYQKYGFIPFVDQPLKLFLPIQTILESFFKH
jgi:GNAT superfamily N-acetyltransferase